MPEEVPCDSDRWRERYSLWQVHTYYIYTEQQHVYKAVNKSTNMMSVRKPRSPLGLYNPCAPPIARDGGPDRFYTGKVGFHPGAVASNLELELKAYLPNE
jgi:hypothetical protein